MKMIKKIANIAKYGVTVLPLTILTHPAFASDDLLADALGGQIAGSFGGEAKFWKIFTLASIVLATGAAVSTKNPMVFIGVLAVSFIPTFLIKTLVF